ncbi:MAG: thioredoxin-disulfide reductase [Bdellovibrionota bacterium]
MSDGKVNTEKVIIIGSGPAGYTAAIYSSRANLAPILFEGDQPGGQLMTTTDVENYPGFADGVMGPEMMQVFRKQSERFGTKMVSQMVEKVDFSKRPFKVWSDGKEYQAQTVIISTGATAKLLNIPSEKQFWGKGVSACATCDGAFFKNVEVAIVGGGDTAMEEALFLTRYATKVHVLHRRDSFRASKIMADRVLNHEKIVVHWDSAVEEIGGDRIVRWVKVKNLKNNSISELKVEGLFVAIGHKPNTDIFKGQLDMNETGYLVTKPGTTYTNVDGVFACGDVQDPIYRQAVTAAGTGCMAAIDSERWLEKNHM